MRMMNNLYPKLSVILFTAMSLAPTIGVAFDYESLFTENARHCADSRDSEQQSVLERFFSKKISERCVQYASKTTRDQLDQFFIDKKLTDHDYRQVIRWLTDKRINERIVSGTNPPYESTTVQSVTVIKPQEQSIELLPTAAGFKSIGVQSETK